MAFQRRATAVYQTEIELRKSRGTSGEPFFNKLFFLKITRVQNKPVA